MVSDMLLEPIFRHAQERPDDVAVIDDTGSYTRRQFAAMVAGLAGVVGGSTQRDAVGILLPSGVGFAASLYATMLAGKTVVPINFLLGDKEIGHLIADSGIDTVLSAPPLSKKLEGSPLKTIDLSQLPKPDAASPLPEIKLPNPSPDDLAVIMYTSGTSGIPKGVELTFGNLHSDTVAAIQHAKLTGEHAFLGVLPLFHSTGMLATLLAPMWLGSKAVYIARFSPVATIKAIREHGISIVAAVPSMYAAICRLKDAGHDDVKTLYATISGGEPLPAAVREAFTAKFELPIYEGFGLTETIGPIAFNVPGAIRPGSVGKLIPGAELKIVDDEGNTVGLNVDGEIWLRGPMLFRGYHNLSDATAAAITPDGFFKSGDIGRMDDDGYLYITGRKKELIIVAGEKAVPREIEEALMKHPAIADAAVVGKPDPQRGEVVVAFVIFKEGQTAEVTALRDFVREQGLVQWKVPREITVVDDLPRTPTGKVLKRELVARASRT